MIFQFKLEDTRNFNNIEGKIYKVDGAKKTTLQVDWLVVGGSVYTITREDELRCNKGDDITKLKELLGKDASVLVRSFSRSMKGGGGGAGDR